MRVLRQGVHSSSAEHEVLLGVVSAADSQAFGGPGCLACEVRPWLWASAAAGGVEAGGRGGDGALLEGRRLRVRGGWCAGPDLEGPALGFGSPDDGRGYLGPSHRRCNRRTRRIVWRSRRRAGGDGAGAPGGEGAVRDRALWSVWLADPSGLELDGRREWAAAPGVRVRAVSGWPAGGSTGPRLWSEDWGDPVPRRP